MDLVDSWFHRINKHIHYHPNIYDAICANLYIVYIAMTMGFILLVRGALYYHIF